MINNPTNQPYFYVITNKVNGRYYYGSGEKDGYGGSGKVLKRAYKKYGKESFEGKILRLFNTREEAFSFEQRFLSLYKLDQDPIAYNVCRNANGGYISDEAYEKNSKFLKEYRQTKEGSIGGLKNPRANQTVYEWYNIDTGEYLKATQYELNQKIGGTGAQSFSPVILGSRRIHKGWILFSNFELFGTRDKLNAIKSKNISESKKGKKRPDISAAKKGVKWWHNPITGEESLCKDPKPGFIRGRKALTGVTYKKVTCPQCGKVGGVNIMPRYHFDNCKQNKQL